MVCSRHSEKKASKAHGSALCPLPRTRAHGRRLQPDFYGNWSGLALRAWSEHLKRRGTRNGIFSGWSEQKLSETIKVWILSLGSDSIYSVDPSGHETFAWDHGFSAKHRLISEMEADLNVGTWADVPVFYSRCLRNIERHFGWTYTFKDLCIYIYT